MNLIIVDYLLIIVLFFHSNQASCAVMDWMSLLMDLPVSYTVRVSSSWLHFAGGDRQESRSGGGQKYSKKDQHQHGGINSLLQIRTDGVPPQTD